MARARHAVVLMTVFSLLVAACGGRSDETDASGETTPEPTAEATATPEPESAAPEDPESSTDPCADVTLEATDIGVTPETITVLVMADVDSPLAPGLFQGSIDGVNAWVDHVNAEGGLACRQIELIEWDSMLNGNETTNGFLTACENAIALVGTTVLFGTNTQDLNTCPDAEGNPIGVPDLAYITTEAPHQCSPNSFHMSRPGAACPYESGNRDHIAQVGPVQYLLDNSAEPLHGVYLVPADLPSTIATSLPQLRAHEAAGIVYDAELGVSGRATQAEFSEVVQPMRESDANWVYNGSNDQAMVKLRAEAEAQGLDASAVTWVCSLSCFTPDFIEQGGESVEGTYVWMAFVPFFEADANAELADFMAAIGTDFPQAWAAGAWADGVLFEQVVNDIVAADGPNAITRARLLEELKNTAEFDANGWWGRVDLTTTETISDCYVLLQVQNGEYVRVFPEEPGTLECDSSTVVAVQSDPADFSG